MVRNDTEDDKNWDTHHEKSLKMAKISETTARDCLRRSEYKRLMFKTPFHPVIPNKKCGFSRISNKRTPIDRDMLKETRKQ